MRYLRKLALLGAVAGLSACSVADTAMRNAPFEALPEQHIVPVAIPDDHAALPMQALDAARLPSETPLPGMPGYAADATFAIGEVSVTVPEALKVNEANLYYPFGDIVWRGDPYGDRKAQVAAVFREALGRAKPLTKGGQQADIEVIVRRFHSVSEKTRYSIGGVHSITFDLVLRDPANGAVLRQAPKIKANLDALGGERAKAAERQGLTMKERITRHLRHVMVSELRHPGGFRDAAPKLAQAADQI